MEPTNRESGVRRRGRTAWLGIALGLAAAGTSGCDFSVTNPGPVQDVFLDDPKAFGSVVIGMELAYSKALGVDGFGDFSKITACVTREIFPSGNTIDHGCDPNEEAGRLIPDEEDVPWNGGQNARWVAQDGIRRMEAVLGSEAAQNELVGRAYLWSGLANKLLGENMCEAVIDGGPALPVSTLLQTAEEHLTKAVTVAQATGDEETRLAALASRASVRMDRKDWTGAVQDASAVPESFSFRAQFFNINENTYNYWAYAVEGAPFRAVSAWNTPYEQYYKDTGDPRTPWTTDPDHPLGNLARPCCGRVPFLIQQKFPNRDSSMDITDGREMLLIRAEAALRDGDVDAGMALVNQLRTTVGVDPWPAPANLEEAWSFLKAERGIELWLEAKRMNDLRRWKEDGTPGALRPLEDASNPDTHLERQDLCFPIPLTEIRTNPNLR